MTKRSTLQEVITILDVYAPNNTASNCIRQKPIELQGEIVDSSITVGNFSTPLSEMDKSSRQKTMERRS